MYKSTKYAMSFLAHPPYFVNFTKYCFINVQIMIRFNEMLLRSVIYKNGKDDS